MEQPAIFLKYLRQLLYFSASAALIVLIAHGILPDAYLSPALPMLILFFMSASLISFRFLQRSAAGRFINFVNAFLMTVGLKLLLYIVVMVGYALLNKADAIPFLLGFFVLYLMFTIFETVFILKHTTRPGSR